MGSLVVGIDRLRGWVDAVFDRALAPFDGAVVAVKTGLAPLRERMDRWPWLRRRLPFALTVALCLSYFVVFEQLVWLRHSHYGTFDYDLGMYDQGIWQLAHGRGFMTVRGMHVFGHHANLGYLLFVPFYWVGIGGPQFLDFVNTAAVVAVAVPVYALARRHLRSSWAGLGLVVAYLFHFAPQWKIQETFHPESLAAPLIGGAIYFASVRRWRPYALCLLGAIIWKEDVAIVVAMIGLAVLVGLRDWKVGLATVLGGTAWFLVATKLFMPYFADGAAVFDSLFGPLGSNATEVVRNSVAHPSRLVTTVQCHGFFDGRLESLRTPRTGVLCPTLIDVAARADALARGERVEPYGLTTMMRPYGYLAFGNPMTLLTGLPQHVVNSATTANFTWNLRWHYAMFPYLGVLFGSVLTVVRRRRRLFAYAMVVVMLVFTATGRAEGVGPWTDNYRAGYWPLQETAYQRELTRAIAGIGDEERVSASYFLVPHLAHRRYIYTFPNPWHGSNYGAGGTRVELPDQNTIDVLVVNRLALNDQDRTLLDAIMASGQFTVGWRSQRAASATTGAYDIIRLQRIRKGPPIS
ncbi:MAG: DUF2079 domain-containing protein [Microthrixaceae bacterium]